MRKLLIATLGLLAGTIAANATPITFTYTVTDSDATNQAHITNVLPSPDTINLTVGTPLTTTLFNLKDTDFTGSSTITANFLFSSPSGSGSPTATDVFVNHTGNNIDDTLTPVTSSFVNFGAAGILSISFDATTTDVETTQGSGGYNNTGLNAPVTFLLSAPTTTPVPEPLTLSIFGAGLLGAAAHSPSQAGHGVIDQRALLAKAAPSGAVFVSTGYGGA